MRGQDRRRKSGGGSGCLDVPTEKLMEERGQKRKE